MLANDVGIELDFTSPEGVEIVDQFEGLTRSIIDLGRQASLDTWSVQINEGSRDTHKRVFATAGAGVLDHPELRLEVVRGQNLTTNNTNYTLKYVRNPAEHTGTEPQPLADKSGEESGLTDEDHRSAGAKWYPSQFDWANIGASSSAHGEHGSGFVRSKSPSGLIVALSRKGDTSNKPSVDEVRRGHTGVNMITSVMRSKLLITDDNKTGLQIFTQDDAEEIIGHLEELDRQLQTLKR